MKQTSLITWLLIRNTDDLKRCMSYVIQPVTPLPFWLLHMSSFSSKQLSQTCQQYLLSYDYLLSGLLLARQIARIAWCCIPIQARAACETRSCWCGDYILMSNNLRVYTNFQVLICKVSKSRSLDIHFIVVPDMCVERTHKLVIDSQEADGDLFPQTSRTQRSWRISIWKIFTKSSRISMGTRLDLLHDPMRSSSLVSSYLVCS